MLPLRGKVKSPDLITEKIKSPVDIVKICRTERYFVRGHIHVACISVYCYNCPILLVTANLLLLLPCRLNLSGVHIGKKTKVYVEFGICNFRHRVGVLEHISLT
jgi:hypothetical protein